MAQDAHDRPREPGRDTLQDEWERLWRAAAARPAPDLLDALLHRYREAHRHYHTLQHLGECLAHFKTLAHLPEHPLEVQLALWFHDAVYDLGRHDNEARSADWAQAEMLAAGLPAEMARRVAALILTTRHDAVPEGIDAQVVVDIDLAILGAAPARFDEYERQVRQEYGHLPDAVFQAGRAALLRQFLARPRLFGTADARERLEAPARQNLARSLRDLAASGPAGRD